MRLDATERAEVPMAVNLWFEHVIDAYLDACAQGRDWRAAVAVAEKAAGDAPRRVLTQQDLKLQKGLRYSRQHLAKKVRGGAFPPPFQADPNWARSPTEVAKKRCCLALKRAGNDTPDSV
jgi:hypothetical protein